MSRKQSTRNRHKRIRREMLEKSGDVLDGHFKKPETKSSDAMSKTSTGGNAFESKRRKH